MDVPAPAHLAARVILEEKAQAPDLSAQRLSELVMGFASARVLVVGDVMLDRYFKGDAGRISPEAPVPVVLVEKEDHVVGGAGNVARNIIALGGQSSLVGTRGKDINGDLVQRDLDREGVQTSLVMLDDRPTTTKLRIMARRQQMLRVDWEDSRPIGPAAMKEVVRAVRKNLPTAGALVVSDYDKGLVTPQFMKEIHAAMADAGRAIPVLVDPKPANSASYAGVTLLTPNEKETGELAHLPVQNKDEILAAGKKILARLGSPYLVATLGARGMALFFGKDRVFHLPVSSREVFDVTGAGDTVIGTLALALASGASLLEAAVLANHCAGIVVSKVGAATASVDETLNALKTLPAPVIDRWL